MYQENHGIMCILPYIFFVSICFTGLVLIYFFSHVVSEYIKLFYMGIQNLITQLWKEKEKCNKGNIFLLLKISENDEENMIMTWSQVTKMGNQRRIHNRKSYMIGIWWWSLWFVVWSRDWWIEWPYVHIHACIHIRTYTYTQSPSLFMFVYSFIYYKITQIV